MTIYGVTAATGHLGRLIVGELLEQGVAPADVVAIVRTPEKAVDLAARGVEVRTGDYSRPDTLATAFAGVNALMFISGSEAGQRLPQHAAVVAAAAAAGVARVVYTSILRADTSQIVLAPEHKATEELLRESGLPYTILRNGWYAENYTAQLAGYLERHAIVGATKDTPVAAAPRSDYARAAVAVLLQAGHEFKTYELGGNRFTMSELAEVITELSGTPVSYHDVPVAELITILQGAGLDAGTAAFVAAIDEGVARGDVDTDSQDLAELIGRPVTPMAEVVRAELAALR